MVDGDQTPRRRESGLRGLSEDPDFKFASGVGKRIIESDLFRFGIQLIPGYGLAPSTYYYFSNPEKSILSKGKVGKIYGIVQGGLLALNWFVRPFLDRVSHYLN